MAWIRKMRPVLIVVGIGLAVGSLVGARALTNGSTADTSTKADTTPRANGGPIVLGLVDTDPPPVAYGLPPVLQSGSIAKVFVKDGDEVKVGQELYAFDATIQERDLKRAQTAVEYARTKVNEAQELADQHTAKIKSMREVGLKAAERKVETYRAKYNLIKDNLIDYYKREKILPEEWPAKLKIDNSLFAANVEYDTAMNELDIFKSQLTQLEAIKPIVKVKEAEAGVEQAKAEQAKAQAAVDLCVVRAKTAGTVEQITISEGTTLGISTRTPALWLIPGGPRVIRAEVEADFAHRIGADRVGKTVTIYDHTDAKITYTGTVRRIGSTFLLKRANTENFLGGDTRVIEAVIEVTDAAPAGKPPLRVGQRVRVNLGQ
jgi:multidrug resistance efflux pump